MLFNEILRVIRRLLFFSPSQVIGIDNAKLYIFIDKILNILLSPFDAAFAIAA